MPPRERFARPRRCLRVPNPLTSYSARTADAMAHLRSVRRELVNRVDKRRAKPTRRCRTKDDAKTRSPAARPVSYPTCCRARLSTRLGTDETGVSPVEHKSRPGTPIPQWCLWPLRPRMDSPSYGQHKCGGLVVGEPDRIRRRPIRAPVKAGLAHRAAHGICCASPPAPQVN